MSDAAGNLATAIEEKLGPAVRSCDLANGEVTLLVPSEHYLTTCIALRDEAPFRFEQLIDLCGVDYLSYGESEWATDESTTTGFSRGVEASSTGRLSFGDDMKTAPRDTPRFAVVLHLLSYKYNHRLRVRCFASDDNMPVLPSVVEIWNCANWYEREAFDLYGILFDGHPDLRRLLTDYGFVGHPFRKDFPLVGQVEMRYDPEKKRVVYQPVSIEPRVLVPRVIRDDNRYWHPDAQKSESNA